MIKQSTTYTFTFLMVLTSDHLSPATGKTVAVSLSKAGAAFGAAAGAVTEIANGWYKCAFTTADTGTLGDLSINATAALCDPTDTREQIVAFDPLAAANLGLTNLDAAVSSRSTYAGGAVASVTGAVGSVTAGVTVTTNNDKTGYGLSAAAVQAVWDALTSALTTVGSIGKLLVTNIDALISSRSTYAGGAVASVTGAVGSVTAGVTVTTNNDKTGYGLSAAAVQAVWDALTSALTTVGSIGKLLVTNIDALISSRSTYAGGAVASVTGAVGSVTAGVTVTTNNDKTGYALTAAEHTAVVADVNTALDAAGTELAAVPGQTATVRQSLRFLFQYFRNKRTVTASVETLYKEDSVTALGTAAITDDGTTATFAKGV